MPFVKSGSLGCKIPVIGMCCICACVYVCVILFIPTGDLSGFQRTQFTVNNVLFHYFEMQEPSGRTNEKKDGADEELIAHLRDELF